MIDPSINGHSLTRLENITLTVILIPQTLSPLCLLLLVRLGGYIENLCVFYFFKIIGKLTTSLQFQEINLHNITESTVLNHFAIKAFFTSRDNKWIQLITLTHHPSHPSTMTETLESYSLRSILTFVYTTVTV